MSGESSSGTPPDHASDTHAGKPIAPLRSITVLRSSSNHSLSDAEISPESVGWKAFGLSALPPDWVPPFVVVEESAIRAGEMSDFSRRMVLALNAAGVSSETVIVRSSGTAETMRQRGRLESTVCARDGVSEAIEALRAKIGCSDGTLHWIVQQHVTPVAKGHLSNERHLSREKRDWVAEFEINTRMSGYATRVAVRRWRDGTKIPISVLACPSQLQVPTALKQVALWASQFSQRLHFEWVWDGSSVYVVQADAAEVPIDAVDPASLRPLEVPRISIADLAVFSPATSEDFTRYGKLRNASIYAALGYEMPPFFVLRDVNVIRELLRGNVPEAVSNDLRELTKRPLIIRTDGIDIPPDRREMLPRSDELRSPSDAAEWLTRKFKDDINNGGLAARQLCLIAHHFIPSIAAAWARAEPNNRIVRIESLWGLPEGLYWYSHDTFEVDTRKLTGDKQSAIRERLRYKGTFIAPDAAGRWIPRRTAPPFDWTRSISQDSWLAEIAHTTRQVADREAEPIALMWFIDNDPRATHHVVLPWYHTRSELGVPKAAPRRKLSVSRDYRISHVSEWEELKRQVGAGIRIERIVIEPQDAELVRSQGFAKDLATLAADNNIVVELAGGILSHAYYMLQRHGAQVECVDLFGVEDDILEFNKLVRDRIPELIAGGGEDVETLHVSGDALITSLRRKLVEEAFEVLDSKSEDELIDELADVAEVILAICNALPVDPAHLESVRQEKRAKRGGFDRGLMLKSTSLPRSLSARDEASVPPPLVSTNDTITTPPPVITDAARLPVAPPYRRTDVRHTGEFPERLVTFETDAIANVETDDVAELRVALERGIYALSAVVDLSRNRSLFRGTIRLRVEQARHETSVPDSQLSINFPDPD